MDKIRIDNKIRLIELFAGVGSQAMALRDIGADFEHYKIVEYDKYPIASYNAIHGTDVEPMDITKIHGNDLEIVDTDKYTYIMTYSFPCQDLSNAGKRQGMKKGDGTRSGLLWEVERLINETDHLPQILLMENVKQIINKKNIDDFTEWCDFLKSKGYTNYYQVMNAKNYGIPQNRERCFMVSVLGDYDYTFPCEIPLNKKLKDYLLDEVDEKYYINTEKANRLIMQLVEKNQINGKITTCDGSVKDPKAKDIANCILAKYDNGISNIKSRGTMVCEETTKVNQVGNIVDTGNWNNPQRGRIYSTDGLSPTLNTCQGGGLEPKIIEDKRVIVAMRGRNPENPSDRTPGIKMEQRLEPNNNGTSNTLTTVQKDNLVLENCVDFYNKRLRSDECCGTIATNASYTSCGTFGIVEKVGVKQATEKGYVECEIGGLADLSYPSSTTRRGRVQENGAICPTLTATATDSVHRIESYYRIRKLTPLECWRLMDFTDEDFYKAETVNSNTQLYKQAGNSIVKRCLMAIFLQMNIQGIPTWNEQFEV